MKNLIILFIIITVSISCKKQDPIQDFKGALSMRFIDKNNEGKASYVAYTDVDSEVALVQTGEDGNLIGIGGVKPKTNDVPYSANISLVRKSRNNIDNYYVLETNLLRKEGAFNFSVGEYLSQEHSSGLTSANSKENLTITKDDATTLEGTFRVKVSDFKQPNPTIREVEGFFSIPKNGRF